jgi:hypothetical protein
MGDAGGGLIVAEIAKRSLRGLLPLALPVPCPICGWVRGAVAWRLRDAGGPTADELRAIVGTGEGT